MPWFQSIRGDRVEDPILTARTGIVVRTPAIRLRLGLLIAGKVLKAFGAGLYLYVRHVMFTGPVTVFAVVGLRFGWRGLGLLLLGLAVVGGVWCCVHPRSLLRLVVYPYRGKVRRMLLGGRFAPAMVTAELSVNYQGHTLIPRLRRLKSQRWFDVVTVRMVSGQIPEDFAKAALRLAHTFGVRQVKVQPGSRPDRVVLHLLHGDPLATVVNPLPVTAVPDFTALPVGVGENGDPFTLCLLGNQVLTVGATSAGKGSVAWSLIRSLAGGITAGTVRLWVFDPKGGMEMAAGAPMFDRFLCDSYPAMADTLTQAETELRARASRLRGKTRQHVPTVAEPLTVILIDELATLTAYTDRQTKERIRQSLSLVLTQGRAVGFHVAAFVQDPRKDVLPFRDLFTIRIGLRMVEPDQVDLVLGDGARDRGALCDQIPKAMPGVAYVVLDGNPFPSRVRISYLSDHDIADMAATYGKAGVINGHTVVPAQTIASNVIDLPNSGWTVNR